MGNTVIYVGNFSFPYGNASGKRVYANGKLLRDLGYNVIFIGMDKNIKRSESLASTKKEYDGFTYYNFPYPQGHLDWLRYQETYKKLVGFLQEEGSKYKIALVIYYGSPCISLFNTKLIKYCKANKIKIVADCVDWLSTKTNNRLFDLVKWTDNTYQKAYANNQADGVIAISSYLANYYEKNKRKTVIIPPLSPEEYKFEKDDLERNGSKVITYAGLPFRKGQPVIDCTMLKDRIDKTVILLSKAKASGCQFVFHIYGFTKDEYFVAIPSQQEYVEALGNSIVFHGHKSHEEVINHIKKSDFTILIRDITKDTIAGFPTKVSESISCGTPVITTRTSDLAVHLEEGENGFFLHIDDECSSLSKIKKILEIKEVDLIKMRKNCIDCNPFYYKKFMAVIKSFIAKLSVIK